MWAVICNGEMLDLFDTELQAWRAVRKYLRNMPGYLEVGWCQPTAAQIAALNPQ